MNEKVTTELATIRDTLRRGELGELEPGDFFCWAGHTTQTIGMCVRLIPAAIQQASDGIPYLIYAHTEHNRHLVSVGGVHLAKRNVTVCRLRRLGSLEFERVS